MVLDGGGLGNDTVRMWWQNALLIVGTTEPCVGKAISAQLCATPAYYAFRHISQFVVPGAHVVGTSGNNSDQVAFKNPDGSIVTVFHNAGTAAKTMIVKIGSANKMLSVPMVPANGWATVVYGP
jgi:glucosylceramidase